MPQARPVSVCVLALWPATAVGWSFFEASHITHCGWPTVKQGVECDAAHLCVPRWDHWSIRRSRHRLRRCTGTNRTADLGNLQQRHIDLPCTNIPAKHCRTGSMHACRTTSLSQKTSGCICVRCNPARKYSRRRRSTAPEARPRSQPHPSSRCHKSSRCPTILVTARSHHGTGLCHVEHTGKRIK